MILICAKIEEIVKRIDCEAYSFEEARKPDEVRQVPDLGWLKFGDKDRARG